MKFKDNPFYKAYKIKKNSNDFEPKRYVESSFDRTDCYYDIDVGMSVILAIFLKRDLISNFSDYQVGIDFKDKNFIDDYDLRGRLERGECFPEQALEILKNVDIKDINSVSFEVDEEHFCSIRSFYIEHGDKEIREFRTYYNKDTDNLY